MSSTDPWGSFDPFAFDISMGTTMQPYPSAQTPIDQQPLASTANASQPYQLPQESSNPFLTGSGFFTKALDLINTPQQMLFGAIMDPQHPLQGAMTGARENVGGTELASYFLGAPRSESALVPSPVNALGLGAQLFLDPLLLAGGPIEDAGKFVGSKIVAPLVSKIPEIPVIGEGIKNFAQVFSKTAFRSSEIPELTNAPSIIGATGKGGELGLLDVFRRTANFEEELTRKTEEGINRLVGIRDTIVSDTGRSVESVNQELQNALQLKGAIETPVTWDVAELAKQVELNKNYINDWAIKVGLPNENILGPQDFPPLLEGGHDPLEALNTWANTLFETNKRASSIQEGMNRFGIPAMEAAQRGLTDWVKPNVPKQFEGLVQIDNKYQYLRNASGDLVENPFFTGTQEANASTQFLSEQLPPLKQTLLPGDPGFVDTPLSTASSFDKNAAFKYKKAGFGDYQGYAASPDSAPFSDTFNKYPTFEQLQAEIAAKNAPQVSEIPQFKLNPNPDYGKPIVEMQDLVVHPDIAKLMEKEIQRNFSQGPMNEALRIYDKLLGQWKSINLNLSFAQGLRNTIGNIAQDQLAGKGLADVGYNLVAHDVSAALKELPAVWHPAYDEVLNNMTKTIKMPSGVELPLKDIVQLVSDAGVGSGFITTENIMNAPGKTGLSVHDVPVLGRMIKGMTAANRSIEDNFRIGHFLWALDKNGGDTVAAIQSVNKYFFDYATGLTDFERAVNHRLMPFYTWTRFNVPLYAKAFLGQENPAAIRTLAELVNYGTNEESGLPMDSYHQQLLPQFIQDGGGIPIRKGYDGNPEYFLLGGWVPAADLALLMKPSGVFEKTAQMLTPFVSEPMQQLWNYDAFRAQQISSMPGQTQRFLGMDLNTRLVHAMRVLRPISELDKLLHINNFSQADPQQKSILSSVVRFLFGLNTYRVDIPYQDEQHKQLIDETYNRMISAYTRGDNANGQAAEQYLIQLYGGGQ